MNTKTFTLDRRSLLRGAGAVLALPWLEAMTLPVRAAETKSPPVRMAFLYMANGVHPKHWTPEGTGRDFKLSPTLEPLEKHKNNLLVLTNLRNKGSLEGDGHYVKTGGWLTGTTITKTTGKDLSSNGVSMDQVAAAHLAGKTPLPSLELGTEPPRTGNDNNVGYTQVYGAHISWRTPTTPLAKEINPQYLFDRLFQRDRAGTGRDERSILDFVSEDAKRLHGRVGKDDRRKLDEYLHSVRALEQRLDHAAKDEEKTWQPAHEGLVFQRPSGIPSDHTAHCRLMFDLMALAFRTDQTRVISFMFGNSVSGRNFSFLEGVKGGHHEISHHQNEEEKLKQYQKINRWHVEQYAYLLDQLSEVEEDHAPLLDRCMIVFGAGMRDGNAHDPNNLPIVLAGRGGGTLTTGRHLEYPKHTPLCNLWLGLLQRMGVKQDKFADSTEVLPDLV